MGKMIDLTGQTFGKLTAIKRLDSDRNGNYFWDCNCDCGGSIVVRRDRLRNGSVKSCGCEGERKRSRIVYVDDSYCGDDEEYLECWQH